MFGMLPPRLRVKVARVGGGLGGCGWVPPDSLRCLLEAFREADRLYEEQEERMRRLSIKPQEEYYWARPPPAIAEIPSNTLPLLPVKEPGRPAKIRYNGKTYLMVVEPPCG